MKRSLPLCLVLVCTVAAGALLFLSQPAEASCFGQCVFVSQDPFCLECQTADEPTGALCDSNGPCSCFWVRCPYSLQSSADVFTTPGDVPEFFQAELTADQTPVPEGDCSLTAQIFGLPVTD